MRSNETSVATWMCSRTLDEVHRAIERLIGEIGDEAGETGTLLDVGCWDGEFTLRIGRQLGARRVLGVEVYEGPASAAERRGVEVARLDLENHRFPWPDESVDAVVCNQVLEHLKNIWLPMNEIHRVLRPGGHAILSVPNLASFHNRVLMALGRQPTSIRVFGPHVRGYTFREFCELVEFEGAYGIERRRGVGFYPIPSPWGKPLSALWKGGSHTSVVLARKASNRGHWEDHLAGDGTGGTQTFYESPVGSASA